MYRCTLRPVATEWPLVPKEENLAIEQTSGRQRINIHGAIDLRDRANPHDRGRNHRRRLDDNPCWKRSKRCIHYRQ